MTTASFYKVRSSSRRH